MEPVIWFFILTAKNPDTRLDEQSSGGSVIITILRKLLDRTGQTIMPIWVMPVIPLSRKNDAAILELVDWSVLGNAEVSKSGIVKLGQYDLAVLIFEK